MKISFRFYQRFFSLVSYNPALNLYFILNIHC